MYMYVSFHNFQRPLSELTFLSMFFWKKKCICVSFHNFRGHWWRAEMRNSGNLFLSTCPSSTRNTGRRSGASNPGYRRLWELLWNLDQLLTIKGRNIATFFYIFMIFEIWNFVCCHLFCYFSHYPAVKPMGTAACHDNCCDQQDKC